MKNDSPTRPASAESPAVQTPLSPSSSPRWLPLLLLALILLLVALIRLRMLSVYLDRDEGEYAYSGQLILDGYPPYLHAYNMKLPGTYYAYAAIMRLFGETPSAIHLGFLLLNLSAVVFVFLLARKLGDNFAAVIAAASFALLALDENVFGLHAQATQFVVAFAAPALFLLLLALERQSARLMLATGIFFGLAFLMKQHGVFFFLFAICLVLIETARAGPAEWRRCTRGLGALFAGFLLPYLLVCFVMYKQGVFARFWFWTVSYAHAYVNLTTPSEALTRFYRAFAVVTHYTIAFWLVALVALTVLVLDRTHWRGHRTPLLLLAFSIASIFPGLYFSEHYFVLVFPALALVTGIGLARLRDKINDEYAGKGAVVAAFVFLLAFGTTLYRERLYFFQISPAYEARKLYAGNPYPEALEIAKYLQSHTTPADRIAVFGSEPEIFFYAHRLAASGQVYTYGFFEKQPFARAMQQQFIEETEAAQPKFAVYIGLAGSWLPYDPGPAPDFDAWMRSFLAQYQIVGRIHIKSMQETDYDWASRPSAPPPPPALGYQLLVYQRR